MLRILIVILCVLSLPMDVLAAGRGNKSQKGTVGKERIADKLGSVTKKILGATAGMARDVLVGLAVNELSPIQSEVDNVENDLDNLKCKNINLSLPVVQVNTVNKDQTFIFGDQFDIQLYIKNNTDYYLELIKNESKLTIPSEIYRDVADSKIIEPTNINADVVVLAPGGEFTAVWSGKLENGNKFSDQVYNGIMFRSGYYDFPLNVLLKVQNSGMCSDDNKDIESYRNINSSHMVRLSNTMIVASSIIGGIIAFIVYHVFAAYIVVRKPYNLVSTYSERLRISNDFKFSFLSIFIVPSIVTIAILSTYGMNYGFSIEVTDFYGAIFVGFIAEFIALKWRGYYLQRFENDEK